MSSSPSPLRRQSDITREEMNELWSKLHEVDTSLHLVLAAQKSMEPKLEKLNSILEHSKGVLIFLTFASTAVGVLIGAVTWAKSHIIF